MRSYAETTVSKNFVRFGFVVVALLAAFLTLHASLPTTQTGQWTQASSLTQSHDGAASVVLQNGAVLIIGGTNSTGVTSSVERFGADGSVSSTVPMIEVRQHHTATLLLDGRVLVIGGDTGSGATNSAEVFDPTSNTWSMVGTLAIARSGHTATLLQDGRVLVAGGANNGSPVAQLEIFDPKDGSFSVAGSLNIGRMNHAAALLSDGRVLIVGGTSVDGSGNASPLASTEIFDPASGSVSQSAQLNFSRANLSAITALDGYVVVAGGSDGANDLASLEIYDANADSWAVSQAKLASPRSQHTAALLPNNNGVLLWGGSSNGTPVQTAEVYIPWNDAIVSGGTMNAAHQLGTGTPLTVEGLYFAAAGSGNSSTELFRFATIKTDKPDYSPGTPVVMTGSGFQPGETVVLTLKQDDGDPTTETPVTADSNGKISYSSFAPDIQDVGTHFHLLAVGQSSGLQAQTVFSDANVIVFSAPSGVTFTLSFNTYNNSTSCSGTATNSSTQLIKPNQTGNNGNLGIGNPKSVQFSAPALSDQGGAFQNWSSTNLPSNEQVSGTNPICIQTTSGNVTGGSFTATYATAATSPTLTNISPNNGNLNSTVNATLTGTNFVSGSTVTFSQSGGSGVSAGTPTSITSTSITLPITIAANATLGAWSVTVTNPGSGGGSAAATLVNGFTVNAPTPTVTSLSPQSATIGASAQTLTINGTNFVSTSTVTYGGVSHTPTFVNGTQLTIPLATSDLATAGTFAVIVTNPGGLSSNSVNFTVNNPVPTLTNLSPNSGNLGQTLNVTLTGTNFVTGSTVSFGSGITVNGTTLNSATSLTADIVIANNASTGTRNVTVTNPAPGGGTSTQTVQFTINNPTTTTAVSANPASPTYGQSVTFTANVTSAAGTPTGSVTFYDAAAAATCSAPGASVALGTPVLSSGSAQASTATLAAGGHTILACYTPTGIYLASNGNVAVPVNKANATISVTGYGVTYNGLSHSATGTAIGVNGETLSGLDLSGTEHTNAGSYSDAWTFTDATGNYNSQSGAVKDQIDQANANISVMPYSVIYNGQPHTATGSATGVKGEALSGLDLAGTTHTNAGTFSDAWTFTDSTGNYKNTSGNVSDFIDRAKVSAQAGSYSGTYDAQPHVILPCALSGAYTGSLVCVNLPASVGPSVTYGAVTPQVTGVDLANFDIAAVAGSYTITPAPLTIKADDQSKTFGDDAPAFTATYTGFLGSDNATNSLSKLPSFTVLNTDNTAILDFMSLKAGSYPIVPSAAESLNYAPSYANGTLKVNKAVITGKVFVNPVDPATVAYGQPLSATVYLDQFNIGGVDVLQPHADPNDSSKQLPPSMTLWLVPVGGNASQALKFGSATAQPTYDNSTATTGTTKTGWTINVSGKAPIPGDYNAVIYGDDPGDNSLTNLQLADAGYFFPDTDDMQYPTLQSGKIDVIAASLTVTARSTSKTYGDTVTFAGTEFDSTGLVGNDAIAKVSLASAGAAAGATVAAPGPTYPITASNPSFSTGDASYYSISYVNGTLTVNKADVSVNVTPYSVTYNGNPHTATGTVTGVNGQSPAGLDLSQTTHTSAGTYNNDPWMFTDISGNYNNTSGSVNDAISQAPLTVTANSQTKVLGTSVTFTGKEFTTTQLFAQDAVTSVTLNSTGAPATAGIGTYPIVPTAAVGSGLSNYAITYTNGTLSVVYASAGKMCGGDYGHVILQPINADGSSNFKQGSTVPAKFRVCDANGNSIGTAGVVTSFRLVQTINGTNSPTVDESVDSTTPDTAFRWDPTGQQWIFNISTKSLSTHTTYVYAITLNDKSTISFQYGLPK